LRGRMFGDADDDQIALDAQPFMILGVFHRVVLSVYRWLSVCRWKVGTAGG